MKNKELDTYKKVNDIVVSFMKEKEVSCEETIHQCDRVIEGAYELIEKLFHATKEQFLEKCDSCEESVFKIELAKCEHCHGKFCESCTYDLDLEDGMCSQCKESLV